MLRTLLPLGALVLIPVLSARPITVEAQTPAGSQDDAAQDPAELPIHLGSDDHRFLWNRDWFELPGGEPLGNTHGNMAVDSKGRIFVNTDTERAVMVYGPDGKFLKAWGKDLARGLHGMTLVVEPALEGESRMDREVLWLAHTRRHEVLKTDLDGKILQTLVWPEASGKYEEQGQFNPTSVAVASTGHVFVADGYGRSYIHRYAPDGTYELTFGGPGQELGQLRTPHGLLIDTRGETEELLVADRENHRLQRFDLEGNPLGIIEAELRRPCSIHERNGELIVADLAGKVTILDAENKLITHLGDQPDTAKRAKNGILPDAWMPGEFISPHYACWDQRGNLLVMDWLSTGRITRLQRVHD